MDTDADSNENCLSKLTLEELKAFKGFNQIGESEAMEIIENLYELANLVYNINE